MYRAAIIGCGKIGSENADDPKIKDIYTHAGAYTQCPDTELVAVCDQDQEKAKRCKERWHTPTGYSDYLRMVSDECPDIVSVCTPDKTHFEIIHSLLEKTEVKVIFAEKPLAIDLDDAEKIVQLAKEKQILLVVNYSRRYADKIYEIKKRIASGEFGIIQTVNGYYCKGTKHNGTHWFDLARFLAGDVRKVIGFDRIREGNDDATYDAWLEFHNGATGFLHSCDEKQFSIFEMDILCSKGRISLKEFGHNLDLFTVEESPYYSGYHSLHPSEFFSHVMKDALLHAVEDIVSCMKTGSSPRCSGNDGIAALKIAQAVGSSAKSGQYVKLDS